MNTVTINITSLLELNDGILRKERGNDLEIWRYFSIVDMWRVIKDLQ